VRPAVLRPTVMHAPVLRLIDSHATKGSLARALRRHSLAVRLLGCFLGIAVTTGFVRTVPEANRLVWVSNGVWLAYLLLAPRSRWVYYLAACAAAQFAAGLLFDSHWQATILLTCLNLGEVLLGALLLRKRSSVLPRFTDPAYLARFLAIAVVISPSIFGALYAAISHSSRHTSFGLILVQWVLADGLGMGITAPACVAILRTSLKENLASLRFWPYVALLGVVSAIAFAQNAAPLSFVVYPLLVLILLRMGLAWAALGTLYTAGVSTWFLMHGRGPFAQLHFIPALGPGIALQLFVASVMFILYSVTVVLESRQDAEKQLEEIASETSEAERRANGAERELMDWKTAQFMEAHLGEEYDALIISVQKFGCFVELFEVFVEGLLPINALEDAAGTRVVFRERDHAIVALSVGEGRRGAPGSRRGRGAKPKELAWHHGDRVRVRAERIDPMRRRVEFAIAEPA